MLQYPFDAGGIITRVLEAGEGEHTVLLLHGFTSRADRWCYNIEPLAALGYRVVAFDLPGHGFATKDPTSSHTISAYEEFVIAVMDGLAIGRAHLVGTSLGGHIMAEVACTAPERADRLVMIGSMGLAPLSEDKISGIAGGLKDMSHEAVRQRLLSVISDPALVTDDLVREDVAFNTSPGARACHAAFAEYLRTRFNDELVLDRLVAAQGRVPLLMVWGDEDKVAPVSIAEDARARIAGSRLAVMHGVSHTPYFENPALFHEIIGAFFAQRLESVALSGATLS